MRAAFLELEKNLFTDATSVRMLTIITPGRLTHSKQSDISCEMYLEGILWEKMGLITKSDCMSVTVLSHAVRHLCHVVDVCYKLLKGFHDYCLFNMSDQIVVGIVSCCFWLKNYKNIVLRYSMTSKQYFCVGELLNCLKMIWMHSNGNCTTVRYHTKNYESWQKNCVFSFRWVCLHKTWSLSTSKQIKRLKQET